MNTAAGIPVIIQVFVTLCRADVTKCFTLRDKRKISKYRQKEIDMNKIDSKDKRIINEIEI